ncbi:ankyrin repeat-containing domain protein [Chaetomium tenue]|uniref:Ankyrin repeat-containing domain protein n=1 Tax=Chaetomium tenue TaxID=1854479 RepID=A0ACB7PEX7_9PEZI|nr:ankyrin repeat-containing domain protein [Chaetomium globosum]
MAQVATLTVKQQYWNLKDDSPSLASWKIREEPRRPISWTRQAQARPKRLRIAECREVFRPNDTLPSIHIHGAACRCAETQTENELQDDALATRIASLTRTILATTTPPPPPPSTTTHSPSPSHSPPRPSKRTPKRSNPLQSLSTTLARFFTPHNHLPTPSIPLQADLCIGAADLDIDKVARYLLPHTTTTTTTENNPPSSSLNFNVNVNSPNHLNLTPLMSAIRSPLGPTRPRARLEMVRFLVEACGADVHAVRVDRVTGVGESVLSMACAAAGGAGEEGGVGVVRYLVGRGVVVDGRLPVGRGIGGGGGGSGGKGRTALHVAVAAGRAEVVRVLVREGGADVDGVFEAAETVEREGKGSSRGLEGGLKGLRVKTRKSVSGETLRKEKGPKHPVSALHLAYNNYACAQVLLESGANVGARDGYGRTPLYWAAEAGQADVVRLLVGAGADINAASDDGVTPLSAVVAFLDNEQRSHGHTVTLKMLLHGEAPSESGSDSQDEGLLGKKLAALTTWQEMREGFSEDEGVVLGEKYLIDTAAPARKGVV